MYAKEHVTVVKSQVVIPADLYTYIYSQIYNPYIDI